MKEMRKYPVYRKTTQKKTVAESTIIQHWKEWAGVTGPGAPLKPQKRHDPDRNATWKGGERCSSSPFLLLPILFLCFFSAKTSESKWHRSLRKAAWKICLFFYKEEEQRKGEEKTESKQNQIGVIHLCC